MSTATNVQTFPVQNSSDSQRIGNSMVRTLLTIKTCSKNLDLKNSEHLGIVEQKDLNVNNQLKHRTL